MEGSSALLPANPADIPAALLSAPPVARGLAAVTLVLYVLGQVTISAPPGILRRASFLRLLSRVFRSARADCFVAVRRSFLASSRC